MRHFGLLGQLGHHERHLQEERQHSHDRGQHQRQHGGGRGGALNGGTGGDAGGQRLQQLLVGCVRISLVLIVAILRLINLLRAVVGGRKWVGDVGREVRIGDARGERDYGRNGRVIRDQLRRFRLQFVVRSADEFACIFAQLFELGGDGAICEGGE